MNNPYKNHEFPSIPKGFSYTSVLVLIEGEESYSEALYGQDGFFRFGYDDPVIDNVEAWMELPRRNNSACQNKNNPVAWMDPRIGDDGFDQEVPAVTWRSPDEQRFFNSQMGNPDRYRICLIPLYTHADPGEVERLRDQLAKRDAEIERLRTSLKDTDRLSFLERNWVSVSCRVANTGFCGPRGREWHVYVYAATDRDPKEAEGETFREAIDRMMGGFDPE